MNIKSPNSDNYKKKVKKKNTNAHFDMPEMKEMYF